MVKPARQPPSSRPKPCASLKKPHESCPFAAPCCPRRKKKDRGQTSAFPRNLPVRAFDSRAQEVQHSPGLSTIELPSAFAESGDRYQALRDSASFLSRAATPPEGHQIGARKGFAPGNTILSQPYRRRVSIDRLNREGGQLTASLEGDLGPSPDAFRFFFEQYDTVFSVARISVLAAPQTGQ